MTPINLKHWRELAKGATKGPWKWYHVDPEIGANEDLRISDFNGRLFASSGDIPSGKLMAYSHPDRITALLDLIDECERALSNDEDYNFHVLQKIRAMKEGK